ncbi:unnamed protein product [Brassica rapa]|uniref:Uncharacterized protein n=2 Tax=Brassica TaxID=3705 RepID=A0A3P5YCX0_BRACM|nr:unnamed protein product [Brassica napus]CAG7862240.1 unnamed protein product [Brassica rapa]VDC60475.1 unnamed protein product [Brassica rapa]
MCCVGPTADDLYPLFAMYGKTGDSHGFAFVLFKYTKLTKKWKGLMVISVYAHECSGRVCVVVNSKEKVVAEKMHHLTLEIIVVGKKKLYEA